MKPTSSSVQSFERPCRDDQRAGTLLVEAGMVREEQNIKKRGSYWQGRGRGRVMGRALMLLFQPLWNHCSRPCGHATTNPCRWAELRPIVSHAHSLEFLQPWIATIKPLGFRRASSEGTYTPNSRRRLPTDIDTFESPTGNAPAAATAGRMSIVRLARECIGDRRAPAINSRLFSSYLVSPFPFVSCLVFLALVPLVYLVGLYFFLQVCVTSTVPRYIVPIVPNR